MSRFGAGERSPRSATFWRAVPPVSLDLSGRPGLRLAVGIGVFILPRASRLGQTSLRVLMTLALRQQVSFLAPWARPIRGRTLILTFPAAAALIKAATIMSKAKQDSGSLGNEQPAWHDRPSG